MRKRAAARAPSAKTPRTEIPPVEDSHIEGPLAGRSRIEEPPAEEENESVRESGLFHSDTVEALRSEEPEAFRYKKAEYSDFEAEAQIPYGEAPIPYVEAGVPGIFLDRHPQATRGGL